MLGAATVQSASPSAEPVASGNYYLPVIGLAGNGEVLTTDNQAIHLYDLMGDKAVLLSFIYTTCSDVKGCPLATQVLHRISRLQNFPDLSKKLRLLTISFNPLYDTPEVMRAYAETIKKGGLEWQFLTTASDKQLNEILENYQQDVQKIYDKNGQFTGTFSHLLRVYLIDADKHIRNIYNADLLQVDHIVNDLQSILTNNLPPLSMAVADNPELYQPGDNKQGYQRNDYQTHSLSVMQRNGQEADLIRYAEKPILGLPKLPVPAENPLTRQKIALGRKLFYDRRLSANNTFSCAMCHIPEQGFSNNEMRTAVGVEGRSVRRNAPGLYNVGFAELLFHDGRESLLEYQVWGPLLAHNEMANPSISFLVDKIRQGADYNGLFEQAFNQSVNMQNIGQALASYQRTLNSADSAFDRWFFAKQPEAISEQAKRGYALFAGKAACSSCHSIGEQSALFTDQKRHNTGVGYLESMRNTPEKHRLQISPGVFVDVDNNQFKSVTAGADNDLGYYEISQKPVDRWAYKTPGLRNIALTAPYMHNGSIPTLQDVLKFYNQGGVANDNLAVEIKPLGLTDTEIAEIVAFLNSLTGSNVKELIADGFAAPIGDN